jgi:signal transduction histidine kinase
MGVRKDYFEAGLRNNEFCMWVTSEPLTAEDARAMMREAIPGFEAYQAKGQIEVIPYTEWYLVNGDFDSKRVLNGWVEKLDGAMEKGFSGLRLTGNTFWLEKSLWKNFMGYEQEINDTIGRYNMIAVCTYSLDACGANEVIDIVNTHQFAMIKSEGEWKLIENLRLKETRKALHDSKAQAELYVDLMAHDINNMNQVAMSNLELALGKMADTGKLADEDRHLLEKSMQSLKDSTRLIESVRTLQKIKLNDMVTKAVDIDVVIRELKAQYSRSGRRSVSINYCSAPGSVVMATDLVREIFSNIISNAIKHSDKNEPLQVDIAVEPIEENGRAYYRCTVDDNGPGITDKTKLRLFNRFQRGDTKANGKGLGLYLVRTLVESYGGKVWAEDRIPGDYTKGTRFVVLLPAFKP